MPGRGPPRRATSAAYGRLRKFDEILLTPFVEEAPDRRIADRTAIICGEKECAAVPRNQFWRYDAYQWG